MVSGGEGWRRDKLLLVKSPEVSIIWEPDITRFAVQQSDEANNNASYTQVTKSKFQVFHWEKLFKK